GRWHQIVWWPIWYHNTERINDRVGTHWGFSGYDFVDPDSVRWAFQPPPSTDTSHEVGNVQIRATTVGQFVKVSAGDSTSGYAVGKIIGDGLTVATTVVGAPGTNQTLVISAAGGTGTTI